LLTICFFNFFSIYDISFFYFTCLWFSKNCKIFVLFYCMDPRFYPKIEIFEIQNFKKNSIVYYFFFIFLAFFAFCFLFHLSKLFQKLWNFLWCFIGRVKDFNNDMWKILKVFLKQILICEIFFFQNFAVYYLFFYFFIIFDILFSISSIWTCQQILEILMLFYFME